ncbi:MAG: class I SAM-dependent methyltransferase, partial [Clostridiales bacterium]|nr:class I SAM-dependent methyltransferase [Clostridiales bacterium]
MNSAEEFDQIAQNIFFPIYDVIAKDILAHTGKTGGRVLDLGCGGGHLGLSVLKNAVGMTAILMDSNPDAALIADRRSVEWGLCDRAVAIVGDAHEIPLPDESVELVVSRGSMFFWQDPEKAFREIDRVLAPGGMSYIGGGMGNRELAEGIEK